MIDQTILDTGPLVAFLEVNEEHHHWATDRFKELAPKFLTCEPVLTEACYLLGFAPKALKEIDRFLENGWIQVPFQFVTERQRVMELMRAYRNVPMSLADACLVRMAELSEDAPIFTLDQHFRIYRKLRNRSIETILPPVTR